MESAYKKLEAYFPAAVNQVTTVEMKWTDLKVIHSILQGVKEESGPVITSADAARTVEIFFGQGGHE